MKSHSKNSVHLTASMVLGAVAIAAAQPNSEAKPKPAEPTKATFLVTGLH